MARTENQRPELVQVLVCYRLLEPILDYLTYERVLVQKAQVQHKINLFYLFEKVSEFNFNLSGQREFILTISLL